MTSVVQPFMQESTTDISSLNHHQRKCLFKFLLMVLVLSSQFTVLSELE